MKGNVAQRGQPGTGSVGVIAMMAAFLVVWPAMTWAGKEKSGLRPPLSTRSPKAGIGTFRSSTPM